MDSLKSICQPNTIDTFNIENLQTDNFEKMTHVSKKLFHRIYPDKQDYSENSLYIQSYMPSKNDHLSLITYQRNYEGENYRVDYIDLINIDSTGRLLDKIRLTAKDNEVVTYEVISFLTNDTLKVIEKISSEPYFDSRLDTLYTYHYTIKLNGIKRIDTLEFTKDYEVRKY